MTIRWRLSLLLSLIFCTSLYCQTAENTSGVVITVSNLEHSIHFYESKLSFQVIKRYELSGTLIQRLYGLSKKIKSVRIAQLQLGSEVVELQEFFPRSTSNRLIPVDSRSNDLWFQHIAIVVGSIDSAYNLLRKAGIQHVSSSPQTLPHYIPEAAGVAAFYFRDPDEHNLEIISFPPGKGDPKWQVQKQRIFLGIDHTAIGVSSTEHSRVFYEDVLGLKTVGQSENYGTEQEHLNQVFGAHLLISGLRAKKGIGVEFLEYLAPPGGRNYPTDSQVSDLWHWHIIIHVRNIEQIYSLLGKYKFISKGIVSVHHPNLNFTKAFLVRDPDNHAVMIVGD